MSDTPRTDAAVDDTALENKNHPHTDWVTADFARELEHELSELRKHADAMCEDLDSWGGSDDVTKEIIASYRAKFPKP